jgi:predicted nucleic acid-binding protein
VSVLVIDASVAAKWVLPPSSEPFSKEALDLLRCYVSGECLFVVPDLFWAEIANIVWKSVRQKRLTKKAAEGALDSLMSRDFPTIPSRNLLGMAFSIATAFDRTVYDALYVALAVDSKAQFVTADERLANALAAHLPVKWLGAF